MSILQTRRVSHGDEKQLGQDHDSWSVVKLKANDRVQQDMFPRDDLGHRE